MREYIKRIKGKAAEKTARRFLKKKGYKIIENNFTCKTGEIDIIAFDAQYSELIFVEVRFREAGIEAALTSINRPKQLRIIRAANYYLLINKKYAESFTRFDVIALTLNEKKKWLIQHIPDAFRT